MRPAAAVGASFGQHQLRAPLLLFHVLFLLLLFPFPTSSDPRSTPPQPRDSNFYASLGRAAEPLFRSRVDPFHYVKVDGIFPPEHAAEAAKEFPEATRDGEPPWPPLDASKGERPMSALLSQHMRGRVFAAFLSAATGISGLVAEPALDGLDAGAKAEIPGLLQTRRGERWRVGREGADFDEAIGMSRRVTAIVYLNDWDAGNATMTAGGKNCRGCLTMLRARSAEESETAPRFTLDAPMNRLVILENHDEVWYGHPMLPPDGHVLKALVVRYFTPGPPPRSSAAAAAAARPAEAAAAAARRAAVASAPFEFPGHLTTADLDPEVVCRAAAATSRIPRVRWQPRDASIAPASPSSIAEAFVDLSTSGWECPIVVYGPHFSETAPVRNWTDESMERDCNRGCSNVDVGSRPRTNGKWLYFSEISEQNKRDPFNTGVRRPPNKRGKIPKETHANGYVEAEDFFCVMHRKDICQNIKLRYPLNGETVAIYPRGDRLHVRYGGVFNASMCAGLLGGGDIAPYMATDLQNRTYREGLGPIEKARGAAALEGRGNPTLYLWAASAGVTSTAHYDIGDNLFSVVQASIGKTFVLSPPNQDSLDEYEFFPFGVRHQRQAQRHFDSEDRPLPTSTTTKLQVFRAHLSRGEALWIPSCWIHHPMTTDMSHAHTVSLSITAGSGEQDRLYVLLGKVFENHSKGDMWNINFTNPDNGLPDPAKMATSMLVFIPTVCKFVWDSMAPRREAAETRASTNDDDDDDDDDVAANEEEQEDADREWMRHRLAYTDGAARLALPWMRPLDTLIRKSFSPRIRDTYHLPSHNANAQEWFRCHELPAHGPEFEDLRVHVRDAALSFAESFVQVFKPNTRLIMLSLALQKLLLLVSEEEGSIADGLRFADQCLLW